MSYEEAENYHARLDAAQEAYSAARDRYDNTKARIFNTDILKNKTEHAWGRALSFARSGITRKGLGRIPKSETGRR